MKPADKAFLDGLRKSVCVDIAQNHWDLVCKAVDDAGDIRDVTGYARTIILQGVEKARFASRSEAGRYAANMRWKGNAAGRKAELAAKYPGVDTVIDLPPPGGKRSAEETARIAANVKRLREERGTGFDSPKMKEQLAYEAKRDQALGAKAADIADAVSEKDEPPTAQQRAKEQADRILAEADAERGKAALRRGGLNPQQTQRAKDDIAAVAPAGTPGPTFDSRSGFKGPKYQGYRPTKVVAQDIRRDLKDAVANGELPAGLKFSVKIGSGRSSAINVRVSGIQATRDPDRGGLTGEAKAVYEKVDRITNAYNRDDSDMMTDYFDVDYYGFVRIDD